MRPLGFATVVTLLLVGSTICVAQQQEPRLISVSATAELRVDPDKVEIEIGVVNRAPTAAAAMAKTDAAVRKLIEATSRFNLGKDDIDAGYTTLSFAEKTDKRPQAYFEANQRLSLTLHDLKKYGAFLSALIGAGANRIDGVTFQASQLPELRKKVRSMAVRAARDKAEQLAQESGVKIIRVHSLGEESSDQAGSFRLPMINIVTKSGVEESEGVTITSRIGVIVTVTASYEIE